MLDHGHTTGGDAPKNFPKLRSVGDCVVIPLGRSLCLFFGSAHALLQLLCCHSPVAIGADGNKNEFRPRAIPLIGSASALGVGSNAAYQVYAQLVQVVGILGCEMN